MHHLFSVLRALLSLALVVLFACTAAAGDRGTGSGEKERRKPEWLSTGLISLPINHEIRVAVVQSRPDRRTIPVAIQLLDQHGETLLLERTRVADGRAAIVRLKREQVAKFEPLLVQARLVFGPGPDDPSSPIPLACPLDITIQTTSGDEDDGPVLSCHATPCECLDGDCGRAEPPGVSADCTRGSGWIIAR